MIDVVVLTRNPDFFARSRASLDGQGVDYHGIVVVSDGATVDADGWVMLAAGTNHSYARSMNYALSQCRGDVVVHYSDDAILGGGTVTELLDHVTHGAPIAAATVIGDRGDLANVGVGFTHAGLSYDLPVDGLPRRCRTVDAVTFACAAFSREVADKLGGFDEDYRYCYDDVDFQMRAREAGFGPPVQCVARVRHEAARTRGDNTAPNLDVWRRKWPPERVEKALGR